MELPQPTHKNYTTLISNIETGQIRIPQFQRDFVWTMDRSAALLDSMVKGYPIGTFIFWRTRESLKSVKNIGEIKLPAPRKNSAVIFVLDGQQRLISLFATLKGLTIDRDSNKKDDFSGIYVNLNADGSEEIVTTNVTDLAKKTFIPLTELLRGDLTDLVAFPKKYHKKLDEYKRRIEAYDFPVIEVHDFSIDVATDIFTRINVSGKTLTVFEIMVAKTYEEKCGFDLSKEYEKLIDDLEQVDYQTISNQTILRLIAQILKNKSNRQTILNLKKDKFIEIWPKAVDSIKQAINCFQNVIGVPVSQLLPYLDLLVLFAYFFYKCSKRPTSTQIKELKNLFWRCSLGGRYDAAIDSRLTQDIRRVDQIIEGKSPNYDWKIDISPEHLIENGTFNPGASFIKAILCVMASKRPWSFNKNEIVRTSNHWLSRSNGKNYHRFFSKAFLKENGIDDPYANSIINVTIAEDYLDKKKIGAKSPSEYIKELEENNSEFTKTIKTHLIKDLEEFGILDNDYDTFIQKRAEVISEEIKKWIIEK